LNRDGSSILVRRRHKVGRPRFDFDAAVTGIEPSDLSLVGMGKQEEAETKENNHCCCCDNGERDKVEQGADIRL
jgi:hypothetical protein